MCACVCVQYNKKRPLPATVYHHYTHFPLWLRPKPMNQLNDFATNHTIALFRQVWQAARTHRKPKFSLPMLVRSCGTRSPFASSLFLRCFGCRTLFVPGLFSCRKLRGAALVCHEMRAASLLACIWCTCHCLPYLLASRKWSGLNGQEPENRRTGECGRVREHGIRFDRPGTCIKTISATGLIKNITYQLTVNFVLYFPLLCVHKPSAQTHSLRICDLISLLRSNLAKINIIHPACAHMSARARA